jgi:hypothetical protein
MQVFGDFFFEIIFEGRRHLGGRVFAWVASCLGQTSQKDHCLKSKDGKLNGSSIGGVMRDG